MTGRFFVDTNVLVYAEDEGAGAKRDLARSLIRRAFREGAGVLSLQVLREFFVVAVRKLGLDPEEAQRKVELYAKLDVVHLRLDDLLQGIHLTRLHSFSLWDALILQAATISGCQTLYTEDLQDKFRLGGLEIRDPFAVAAEDLETDP